MISVAKRNNLKKYKIGLIVSLMSVLSACSILPKSQPLSIYRLDVPANIQTKNHVQFLDISLKISNPHSSSFINNNRILVRTSTGEINAYKGARWADATPIMFRNYLIDYFRDSGSINTVVNDAFSINSDINLEIDLRKFESSYEEQNIFTVIDFDAILINNKNQKAINAKNFKIKHLNNNADVVSVVQQFNASSQLIADDLLLWVNEQIAKVKTK